MSEGETLTHLRDKIKMEQLDAFEIIQQWKKENSPPQQVIDPRNIF